MKKKRNHRKWFRGILRRRMFVVLLLILQVLFLYYVLRSDSLLALVSSGAFQVIGILLALRVIYKPNNGSMKTGWILLLLLFPVAGSLLYLIVHTQQSTRRLRRNSALVDEKARPYYNHPGDALSSASKAFPENAPSFRYLQETMGFPVFDGTSTRYYAQGESFLPEYLEALNRAENYIFIEYFIIGEGRLWDQVVEILKQKAAAGLDVRVIYDDVGCFLTLPKDYRKTLESWGIQCVVFNPFVPVLSAIQNNRDHRKITVIDGKVAFTGGLNLADEYANLRLKYGYWKDVAIRLEGKAAWSYTLMFLEMWVLCKKTPEDPMKFYPSGGYSISDAPGFVQPYADSPLDEERVGESVYLRMIGTARDTLYITTPYLIVDDRIIDALVLAAKSGVDVRIITPRVADKPLVHATTRSYYRRLIEGGVLVYEYSAGFIHCKNFIVDDSLAACGTINLDFRSLCMQFECGALLCGTDAISEMKEDFRQLMFNCHRIDLEECSTNPLVRLFQEILRLFAPLM